MKIYLKNIERLRKFYQSDFYWCLKTNYPEKIKYVEDALYDDPDGCDDELYKRLSKKYNNLKTLKTSEKKPHNLFIVTENQEIKMSADFICGYKSIRNVISDKQEFLCTYKKLRSSTKLHFLWPQHKAPTINTLRYGKYNDRIDYLLYDLKLYFIGRETPMQKAYKNNNTKIWLDTFAGNFENFVHQMHFEDFVNENYDVLDIKKGHQEIVTGELEDLVTKANKKVNSKSQERCYQKDYLKHLLTSEKFYRPDDLY